MITELSRRAPIVRMAACLRKALRVGLTATFLAAFMTLPVGAATFTVVNTNDSGAGSLRQAIAGAAAGDTINFAIPGCPGNVCTITLTSGELPITVGLTITGPGAAALIVSGNLASRIFNITAATTVSISGMTLRNGKPVGGSNGGGAILMNTGAAALPLNLTAMTIANNDVTLAGNPLGGGIDNEGGVVTITQCAIVNNVATFRGGGIQNQGFGSMTIVNSTFAGNTAGATGIGGAIRSLLPLTLTNDTIFGNSAQSGGNVSRSGGAFDFRNTIIAGGTLLGGAGPDIDGTINSLDYNLIQDPTGATITGTTTHNITGVAPLLSPLADNGGPTPSMRPLTGSPVLDQGSAAVAVDQRGFLRPVDLPAYVNAAGGNGSDIGAVEAQAVDHLTFFVQPTNTLVGATITPAVLVRFVDIDGLLTAATDNVVLTIGTNPAAGTLAGTATQAAVAGTATFNNLSINNAGTGYTLVAQSLGTGLVISNAFNILAPVVPPPVSTPTLTDAGLVLFALMLLGLATLTLRTRFS